MSRLWNVYCLPPTAYVVRIELFCSCGGTSKQFRFSYLETISCWLSPVAPSLPNISCILLLNSGTLWYDPKLAILNEGFDYCL